MSRDPSKRFMGNPCRHGHSGERYVSNGDCCECVDARVKAHGGSGTYDKRRGRHGYKAFTRAYRRPLTASQKHLLEEMRAGLRSDLAKIMKS